MYFRYHVHIFSLLLLLSCSWIFDIEHLFQWIFFIIHCRAAGVPNLAMVETVDDEKVN